MFAGNFYDQIKEPNFKRNQQSNTTIDYSSLVLSSCPVSHFNKLQKAWTHYNML